MVVEEFGYPWLACYSIAIPVNHGESSKKSQQIAIGFFRLGKIRRCSDPDGFPKVDELWSGWWLEPWNFMTFPSYWEWIIIPTDSTFTPSFFRGVASEKPPTSDFLDDERWWHMVKYGDELWVVVLFITGVLYIYLSYIFIYGISPIYIYKSNDILVNIWLIYG